MSDRPHILFHRPTPWHSEIRCSTKIYARQFASMGYRVSYLQSSVNLMHLLLRKGYYHTYKRGARMEDGIWVCSTFSIIPYLDRVPVLGPLLVRLSYRWTLPGIRTLVRRSGYGDPDVIWTTVPGSSALGSIFPKARLLFHVIDNYSAYRGKRIRRIEAVDYQRSDSVFVIGDALRMELYRNFSVPESKLVNLGQGVDLAAYGNLNNAAIDLQRRTRAIWLGKGSKLDRGLIEAAAQELEQQGGELILAGSEAPWFTQLLQRYTGIQILGGIAPNKVPVLLQGCSIGLMLYDRQRSEIYEGQHPLKLYEYAAAGLHILSTPHTEYEHLAPPVHVVQDEEGVRRAIREVLATGRDRDQTSLDFARQHSWEQCCRLAEQHF